MKLHTLKSSPGSRPTKHRVGRGHAAGKGKQAGKGQSGQNKRGGTRPGFEGGQNPWYRRLPKRGFKNVNRLEFTIVSLNDLNNNFKVDDQVNHESLKAAGLIKSENLPVKILATGKISIKLFVKVNAISKQAKEAIESVGGKVEVV